MGRITDALKRARDESNPAPRDRESSWDPATLVADNSLPETPPLNYRTESSSSPASGGAASRTAPASPRWKQTAIADMPPQEVPEAFAERLVTSPDLPGFVREQHRRLAAELHRERLSGALKVVMITSARPGEGKTLTAANLALTLSESFEETVLLIDADLRAATLRQVFGVKVEGGLGDMLTGCGPRLLQASPRLSLLLSSEPDPDPLKVFASDEMRAVMTTARESFDWVVMDTPPTTMPETPVIGTFVDVALVVVAAGSTDYSLVQEAMSTLGLERVAVVLNRVAERDVKTQSYGYDYYPKARP